MSNLKSAKENRLCDFIEILRKAKLLDSNYTPDYNSRTENGVDVLSLTIPWDTDDPGEIGYIAYAAGLNHVNAVAKYDKGVVVLSAVDNMDKKVTFQYEYDN